MESVRSGRKAMKELSYDERVEALTRYEKYQSKYPKGQMCTFYLRGLCWFEEKCQFAHGLRDLNFDNFMIFHQNKKGKQVTNYDLVRNVQKNYLILKRDYKILFEFQEQNKEKFINFYTYEQLNADARKRVEVRRIFHNHLFHDFCRLIFQKFDSLSIENFDDYVDSLEFSYNVRYFVQKHLFSKSVIDKSTSKKKSIIKLMPSGEDMMANFIKILIAKIEEDMEVQKEKILPLSYKYVNNIINKNIGFQDPLIHHYLKVKNMTSSEFVEELINNQIFYSQLENVAQSKGLPLPSRDNLVYSQNITEILTEMKDTCWEKFFNTRNEDVNFGLLNFDFIKDHYTNKIIENKHCSIHEPTLLFLVKKVLNHGKNLIFLNNNYKYFIFNPVQFSPGVSLKDYFESHYDNRCGIEDSEVQKMVREILPNENEVDLSGIKERISLQTGVIRDVDQKEFTQFNNQEMIIIEDFLSFYYFILHSENFKQISVDLEGKLSKKSDCEIDLIQICDSETGKIFIFDIYKILNIDSNIKLFKEIKIALTWIFESNEITKIFHDGRNDVFSLHTVFQICPTNYIDTSCLFSAIKQFTLQIDFFKTYNLKKLSPAEVIDKGNMDVDFNNLYSYLYNSVNPGINKVLEKYEPGKNINYLKDKMHQLFAKENSREEFFTKRPIDEEFLLYSALDVKYLHGAVMNIKKELEKLLKEFYGDSKHLEIIMRLLSDDHLKTSCDFNVNI